MAAKRQRTTTYQTYRKPARSTKPGYFIDGVWRCNCDEKPPAVCLEVRKEGPNRGKWFYTCEKERADQCGFFLWKEAAQKREAEAVLNNSRTEPGIDLHHTPTTTTTSSDQNKQSNNNGHMIDTEPDSDGDVVESPLRQKAQQISRKRTAAQAELDNFEIAAPGTPTRSTHIALMTPEMTASRHMPWNADESFALADELDKTPSKSRSLNTGLQTPVTLDVQRYQHFVESSGGNDTDAAFTTPDKPIGSNGTAAPRAQRAHDALTGQHDSESELVAEIRHALSQYQVPQQLINTLCGTLTTSELKAKGYLRGRDMTRVALATEKQKVSELQQKITTLETRLAFQQSLKSPPDGASLRR